MASEVTGTKIVGYGSGRLLSSRVRFGSGRSFKMSGRVSSLVGLFGRVVKYLKNQKKRVFELKLL